MNNTNNALETLVQRDKQIKKANDKLKASINELDSELETTTNALSNHANDTNIHTSKEELIKFIVDHLESLDLGITKEVVSVLPTENISDNTLYFVPNEKGYHNEYLYINDKWELVGSTETNFTDYYTKLETNTLLEGKANSVHTHVVSDITDFPTIPTKVSELSNDSNFVTSTELHDYATKNDLNSKQDALSEEQLSNIDSIPDKANKSDLSTVATSGSYKDLLDKPVIPEGADLSDYYNKGETDNLLNSKANTSDLAVVAKSGNYNDLNNTPTIPTKVSDLTNDSGYITGVAWGNITSKPIFSDIAISGSYNDLVDAPTIPTKTSELTNDSGYITSVSWEDVTSKPELAQVAISGSYSDLSGAPTIPTRTSQLINDSGFLTSSSGVITSVSWSDITNKPNFATVATSGSYTDLSNTPTIPTKISQLENDMGFGTGGGSGDTSDCVHKTGNETIAGIKTFSDITVSNKELRYRDTTYDWTDTSLNVWCDAGHVAWFDKTGNRRMHELVGAQNGVWRKACYINENQYFKVDSNRNISYEGISFKFNGKNIALDENLVHRTGDEHIHGTKMFSNTIHRYADLTTSTSEQVYNFYDSNANTCGHIYNNAHWYNNAVYNTHGAYNAKSGKVMAIDMISRNDGRGIVNISGDVTSIDNVTTVTSATGHTAIATMGWVNNPATSTNVVHRTGDETIAGNKTFSNKIKGNLQGNADTATKSSYLDNYSVPGMNKIYLDWDQQVESYVGLKVDNTTMGGLITTKNIGYQSVSSATYSTTPATTDNSTRIATTAWVRNYVNSVGGSGNNTLGSSISAYWSNSSNVTATGRTSASGTYPACYSEYITKTPTVGTIYSGAQLYTKLAPYASATASTTGQGGSIKVTNITAQATFSNPISSTGKYLCTTANTVKFRAYVTAGSSSSLGTASVVDNSSTKSIFIRVQ